MSNKGGWTSRATVWTGAVSFDTVKPTVKPMIERLSPLTWSGRAVLLKGYASRWHSLWFSVVFVMIFTVKPIIGRFSMIFYGIHGETHGGIYHREVF